MVSTTGQIPNCQNFIVLHETDTAEKDFNKGFQTGGRNTAIFAHAQRKNFQKQKM